jgi:hypothetical protein
MSISLRLKRLDGEKKTIELFVKSEIVGLDGNNKTIKKSIPIEEINLGDLIVFRVKEQYCTYDQLNDICETVGELKKRGQLKQSTIVVPEHIEICKLFPDESINSEEVLV